MRAALPNRRGRVRFNVVVIGLASVSLGVAAILAAAQHYVRAVEGAEVLMGPPPARSGARGRILPRAGACHRASAHLGVSAARRAARPSRVANTQEAFQ